MVHGGEDAPLRMKECSRQTRPQRTLAQPLEASPLGLAAGPRLVLHILSHTLRPDTVIVEIWFSRMTAEQWVYRFPEL
jgi:hypothetical protein